MNTTATTWTSTIATSAMGWASSARCARGFAGAAAMRASSRRRSYYASARSIHRETELTTGTLKH